MSEVSRNDPCPCGSGKKYKKCCIDKVLPFPNQESSKGGKQKNSQDFIQKVKNEFANKSFNSLEEANRELAKSYQDYNKQPVQTFLGLSPNQMSEVLNPPFLLDNEVFKIEITSKNELSHVPILNHALYVLRKLKEVGELKATQKGNFPRAFVVELYEQFFSKEKYARKPKSEDDLPHVTRLKHLLDMAGLIKKRNRKFSLTKKGALILEKDKKVELFEVLFINYANIWYWEFMDWYPEFYLIQRSISFNFLLLHKKCVDWTLKQDLGQAYLEAFPALVREVPHESYITPKKQVIQAFTVRFLNRFCLPLGLVDFKEEKVEAEGKWKLFDLFEYYRPTSFFEKNFKFKINK